MSSVDRRTQEIRQLDALRAEQDALNPPRLSEAGRADARAVLTSALAALDAGMFDDVHHLALHDLDERLEHAESWE